MRMPMTVSIQATILTFIKEVIANDILMSVIINPGSIKQDSQRLEIKDYSIK